MFRLARRSRLRLRLLAPLVGVSLTAAAIPVGADHKDHKDHDDPALYGEPHAGWSPPPRGAGRLVPATGALLGVHPSDSHSKPITEEHQHIIGLERALGRTLDINNSFYGQFDQIARNYEPGSPTKRGLAPIAFWDIENGRIPLISWGCKGVRSKEVARGDHDQVIRKTAMAFRDFGHDVFVRYCWEMDGSKRVAEVGPPDEFNAAWIRIWEIFQGEGVNNVVWVWCGNANSFKHRNSIGHYAWDYYPGDQYVDWVCADGYNWGGARRGGDRWRGMVEIFDEFMVWARSTGAPAAAVPWDRFPDQFPRKRQVKPVMIGEYGALEDSSDPERKARWMRETHDTLNGDRRRTAECPHCGVYSDIAAMVYFDINADKEHQNGDWRIMSSTRSVTAFREAASDQAWFNQIHTIGWAPAAKRADAPLAPPPPLPVDPERPSPIEDKSVHPRPVDARSGYWMLGSDGRVYAFGDADTHGDPAASVAGGGGMATDVEPTPSGRGYWIVDSAGAVFSYGDAAYHGGVDTSLLVPGEQVTSLSATPTGGGYWIFTTRGRVLAFGDARFLGDMSAVPLNGPVLDSIPTPTGRGYYMVASDGGIFAFGDAAFRGSMGGRRLNAPVQSLVPDGDGTGYWLVAADGGVFAFDAPFRGSMGATPLNQPITGMVPFGDGYLMVAADGGVFNFSDRPFSGSLGAHPPARPIVAVAAL